MNIIFRVTAIITRSERDSYNRFGSSNTYERMESNSLSTLYEKMADMKLHRDYVDEDYDDEGVEVTFSNIEEIDIRHIHKFNKNILMTTPAYVEHIAKLEAKRIENEAIAKKNANEQEEAQREYELQTLAILKKKYEDENGN